MNISTTFNQMMKNVNQRYSPFYSSGRELMLIQSSSKRMGKTRNNSCLCLESTCCPGRSTITTLTEIYHPKLQQSQRPINHSLTEQTTTAVCVRMAGSYNLLIQLSTSNDEFFKNNTTVTLYSAVKINVLSNICNAQPRSVRI